MDIRRRHLIIALVVFGAIAVIVKPELISMLFVLVFVGIVPGTQLTIPSWITMLGFVIAVIIGIRWVLDQPIYRPVTTPKDKSRRAAARRRVLRQTATRKVTRRHYRKSTAKV